MSENTPRGPFDPPERESGGPPPTGTPPGVTPPGAPPPGGGAPPPYGGTGGGAHGAPPPAYGGAGPAAAGTFRVGEALGFAWSRFTGNALLWILFVLLVVVVNALFNSGNISSYQEMAQDPANMAEVSAGVNVSALSSLLGLVGAVVTGILQALGTNAALREVSGEKPTFGQLFRLRSWGMVVLTALLLLLAQFVGLLLCGVGLLVVAVFAVFTYQGVIDKGQGAWEAFTTSFKLVGRNFGSVFLLELALLGLNIVGALLCGLGLLITIPLTLIATSFAYRRLAGGPVMA
ncbi:hypothetical protein GCM10028784_02620 [Myceligenerans cantabricum]